ncbi:MAG TPA: hypothetical protein VL625_01550 [Patescibacteria group bacterium]|jgi:hypothetical protein|nr:hypothetical protein [Patescibacteria group bacterium]
MNRPILLSIFVLLLAAMTYSYGHPFQNRKNEKFGHALVDLLEVADNDRVYECDAGYKTLDMAGRKKYFTDRGWKDYQQYVTQIQTHLRHGRNTYARFIEQTESFDTKVNDVTGFNAIGEMGVMSCDTGGELGLFRINARFDSKTGDKPESSLIDYWQVELYLREDPRHVQPSP